MRTKDFLRSSLLVREPKFIGLMSFPAEAFPFVRREIMSWILIREQENARALGLEVPTSLDGEEKDRDTGGCVFRETEAGSAIEFAVGKDLAEVGAALRYFHYFQKRDKAAGRTVQLTNEGFMTSFLFQENRLKNRIYMWLRLEFCHSSLVPERRINSTVPRIFNDIRDRCPGVRFEVHAGSDRERIAREWNDSPTYEAIEEDVRSEHRSLARTRTKTDDKLVQAVLVDDPTAEAKRELETSDPQSSRASSSPETPLERLHAAVRSLKDFCVHYFDPRKESLPEIPSEVPSEPASSALVEAPVKTVDETDLCVRDYRYDKPIHLIDEFERYENGKRKYKRLILEHFMIVHTSQGTSWLDLIIERGRWRSDIADSMPLSSFMKSTPEVGARLRTMIMCEFGANVVPPASVRFTKVVELRTFAHVDEIYSLISKSSKRTATYFLTGAKIDL